MQAVCPTNRRRHISPPVVPKGENGPGALWEKVAERGERANLKTFISGIFFLSAVTPGGDLARKEQGKRGGEGAL